MVAIYESNQSEAGSHFVFLCELRGEWYLLLTFELANENALKGLFTCVVYLNHNMRNTLVGSKALTPKMAKLPFNNSQLSGSL